MNDNSDTNSGGLDAFVSLCGREAVSEELRAMAASCISNIACWSNLRDLCADNGCVCTVQSASHPITLMLCVS